MGIGMLSDVHANLHALQAVLADIDAQGSICGLYAWPDLPANSRP